jgi:hypothetical protein
MISSHPGTVIFMSKSCPPPHQVGVHLGRSAWSDLAGIVVTELTMITIDDVFVRGLSVSRLLMWQRRIRRLWSGRSLGLINRCWRYSRWRSITLHRPLSVGGDMLGGILRQDEPLWPRLMTAACCGDPGRRRLVHVGAYRFVERPTRGGGGESQLRSADMARFLLLHSALVCLAWRGLKANSKDRPARFRVHVRLRLWEFISYIRMGEVESHVTIACRSTPGQNSTTTTTPLARMLENLSHSKDVPADVDQ